jgi:hypothetical protein
MSEHASGTFEIQNWQQRDYDETEPKLSRASVVEAYSGDIEALANVEYLMASLPDGSAQFVGQVRLSGRIGNREGSFVVQDIGEYVGGDTARGRLVIVAGSGTCDLSGLRGEGTYVATHGEKPIEFAGRTWNPTPERTGTYVLDYDFD